ncbi:hypothetical protein D3OALGA1CA_3091 [Olavius algarvensis associated proteobacterium Delta 3]|nr:hypothetical protein D3OALGA1CA_3091 [Olavius algarvensis associated proteobacterium Delta 3]CAB5158478.1 hypothetical protein D3OALGB2SA_5271 [Olavius algarvensis associated proteobacterium Delta 3]
MSSGIKVYFPNDYKHVRLISVSPETAVRTASGTLRNYLF